jgi:hypothetical protein
MVGGGISLGTPGGAPGVRNPGGGGGEGVGYVIGPGGGVTLTSISRSDGVGGGVDMVGGGIFTSPTKGRAPGGIPPPVGPVGTGTDGTGIGGDMVGGGIVILGIVGGDGKPLDTQTLPGIGVGIGGGFTVSRRLLITRSRIQSGSRGSGRGPGPLPHGIHLPLVDI